MRLLRLFFALCAGIILSCKEPKMSENGTFLLPLAIPFTYNTINHLFPVVRERSVGIVYGETWAIGTINENKIKVDVFPEEKFSIPTAKAIAQHNNETLYVKGDKSVFILNWKDKELSASFSDISKSISVGLDISKVIDRQNGIVLSLYNYDDEEMNSHYSFVIDDIANKKRLKEYSLPGFDQGMPAYFTPSFIVFRPDWNSRWKVLDNSLNETSYPLVDLLNRDLSDSVIAICNDNMFISEEEKHALIITYSKAFNKDMLYLARWYDDPEIIPIPIDSAATAGERRLIKSPNCNTMSPSGKWVYFATNGGEHLEDTHYLVYLDPTLPNGFLPPFKLGIEGNVEQASWMTTPEGLVLYKDDSLLYFDLSNFKPQDYAPAK